MLSLQWFVHRFKNMPLQEIPHRISERIKVEQDKKGFCTCPSLSEDILKQNIPSLPWKLDLTQLSEEWKQQLHSDAETIMKGNFQLLSTNFEHGDDWGKDPNGTYWDNNKNCHLIDIQNTGTGKDIKLAWELLKMPHIQITAWSAALGNQKAEIFTKKCLHSFLDWNKPFHNILYVIGSGYNMSCLLLSWLFVASLCPHIFEERQKDFWHAIHHFLYALRRYPSLYSSANNHRIAELTALYIYDRIIPQRPQANAQKYLDEINQRIPELFFPDGVNKEQSFHYQANTLEFLLLAQRIATHYKDPLHVDSYLMMSCSFLHSLCDRTGMHFDVGDNDLSFVCRERLEDQCASVAITGAIASLFDLNCVPFGWNFGPRAILFHIPKNKTEPSLCVQHRHFPMGGYTVFYHKNARLLFDHAPLGFQSTGGHGHADALSIWLTVQDIPFLVDWGTYRYNGDPKYRTQARSTSSHNTITIDDQNQSKMTGPFLWGKRANCQVVQWNKSKNYIEACHDGYEQNYRVKHHRNISCQEHGFLIEDFWNDVVSQKHRVVSRFLLHENIHVSISNEQPNTFVLTHPNHPSCIIHMHVEGEVELDIQTTWYAPKYYQQQQTSQLLIQGHLPHKIYIDISNI